MHFVYLDEFGHAGPYFGRGHHCHNHSPIFGLAGIIFPEEAVRPFASFFMNRKAELLGFEMKRAGKAPYEWEKKGTSLYTPRSISKYPEIRRTTFRILNKVKELNGRIFYCGREKRSNTEEVNSTGLYTTIFAEAIRKLNSYCEEEDGNFVIVVDEHSARKELLETASKTMFGAEPATRLASPPFEVESYLNQNIQAADWIAALVGRLFAYRIAPAEYGDLQSYEKYFATRLQSVATHSSVM